MLVRRLAPAAVAAPLLALALAGCGSGGTPAAGPGSGVTLTTSPGTVRTVDEHDAGTTVTVPVGGTVTLVLHSTYWSDLHSSASAVLRPLGTASASPAPRGPRCQVVGSGCGTVTQGFRALAPGTALLTADRTSCGEAMRCPDGKRGFTVTLVVR